MSLCTLSNVRLQEQQTGFRDSFRPETLNLQSSDSLVMARSHGPLPLPLSSSQLPSQLEKEAAGRKGRRSNGDGQEGKPRRKRSEAKVCIYLFTSVVLFHSVLSALIDVNLKKVSVFNGFIKSFVKMCWFTKVT